MTHIAESRLYLAAIDTPLPAAWLSRRNIHAALILSCDVRFDILGFAQSGKKRDKPSPAGPRVVGLNAAQLQRRQQWNGARRARDTIHNHLWLK